MRTSMRARVTLAVVGGLLLFPTTSSAAAGGHGGLVSSDPGAGSTVTIAPLFVRLDFGHDLLELGAAVRVTGPDGDVVSAGAPRLYPTTVSQALAGDLPAGRYQVSWRVTADDGRPISGSFGFSADEGTRAAEAPAALPAVAGPTAAPPTDDGGRRPLLGPAGALVAVVAIIGSVVLLARRRRRLSGSG